MAQMHQQGVVPLANGVGYVARSGNFNPGEYAEFSNVIIDTDGTLTNRRNLHLMANRTYIDANQIIGVVDDCLIYAKRDHVYVARRNHLGIVNDNGSGGYVPDPDAGYQFSETFYPRDVALYNQTFGVVQHVFKYNKRIYFVFNMKAEPTAGKTYVSYNIMGLEIPPNTSTYEFLVRIKDGHFFRGPSTALPPHVPHPDNPLGSTFNGVYGLLAPWVGDVSSIGGVEASSWDRLSPKHRRGFIKGFLHKDRYFLVTTEGIYFSAAFEPEGYTLGGGDAGFFAFEGGEVRDVISFRDNIYVLTENDVRVVQYNIDPNDDSDVYIHSIGHIAGGHSLATDGSSLFAANLDGLWEIQGGSVTRAVDWPVRLDDYATSVVSSSVDTKKDRVEKVKIAFSSGRLYVLFYGLNEVSIEGLGGHVFSPEVNPEYRGYNFFQMDISTGVFSTIDYFGQGLYAEGIESGLSGGSSICDMFTDPREESDRLYLQSSYRLTSVDRYVNTYLVMGDMSDMVFDEGIDTHTLDETIASLLAYGGGWLELADDVVNNYNNNYNHLFTLVSSPHRIRIKIVGYTPDGNKYLVKKFRNLLITASRPVVPLDVTVSFDEHVSKERKVGSIASLMGPREAIVSHVGKDAVPPVPLRFGVNQRGRSITIYLDNIDNVDSTQFALGTVIPNSDVASTKDNRLRIRDIRLLWGSTEMNVSTN